MAKLHRKELKQDEIREKFAEAVKSVSLHGREIVYIISIIVAVGLVTFAWYYYERRQQQQAQNLLGLAMEKFQATVGEASTPGSTRPNYKTEQEKYAAAMKDFAVVIKKYGNTPAADMARYEVGICAFYLKDYKKAEEYLKESAKVSDRNVLYFESRIALANLYNLTGQPQRAIQVIREAIEKDKGLVPPEYLLMVSANSYAKAGNAKVARETYQKILNQYKDSPISYQAQMQLNELNRQ